MTVHSFIAQRQNLRETRFVDEDRIPLADGSVRLRIDRFALTSNNVTYGAFGDALTYSCSLGGTHWDELGGGKGLPGPRPVLFFAPAQIKKRRADWGADSLQQRIGEAWTAFTQRVAHPDSPWLRVVHGRGPDAVQRVYASLLAGTMPARQGHMLSLS
jgi:hypothetical protein